MDITVYPVIVTKQYAFGDGWLYPSATGLSYPVYNGMKFTTFDLYSIQHEFLFRYHEHILLKFYWTINALFLKDAV